MSKNCLKCNYPNNDGASLVIMATFKFLLDFLRYENYIKKFTINQMLSLSILLVIFIVIIYKKINKKKIKI